MGARNRDAAVAYSATPTILPSSKKTLAKSSGPWSVAKRCLANDGEGDLFLVLTTTVDVTLLLANGIGPSAMNRRHWRLTGIKPVEMMFLKNETDTRIR